MATLKPSAHQGHQQRWVLGPPCGLLCVRRRPPAAARGLAEFTRHRVLLFEQRRLQPARPALTLPFKGHFCLSQFLKFKGSKLLRAGISQAECQLSQPHAERAGSRRGDAAHPGAARERLWSPASVLSPRLLFSAWGMHWRGFFFHRVTAVRVCRPWLPAVPHARRWPPPGPVLGGPDWQGGGRRVPRTGPRPPGY